MRTGVFVGRFQPFHEGHKKCVEKILSENDRCVILMRDVPASDNNPFELEKRKAMIRATFPDTARVDISIIRDPGADLTVYIGRDVGYELIQLDAQTESVSATDIRKKLYENKNDHRAHGRALSMINNKEVQEQPSMAAISRNNFPIFWLTGNTGAGKTTLARSIEKYFNEESSVAHPAAKRVIVLDGDEMRATISTQDSFSAEDRRTHNLRVARLAKLFQSKGFLVIVSVIAPFEKVRSEIDQICDPLWVYLKRSHLEAKDKPYEFPTHPVLVIDQDVLSVSEGSERLLKYIIGTLTKDHVLASAREHHGVSLPHLV